MTRREVLARYGRDVLRLEWGDVTRRVSMLEAEAKEALDAGMVMARRRWTAKVDAAAERIALRMAEIGAAAFDFTGGLLGPDGKPLERKTDRG